ncbi:hypothetical protein Tco_1341219 [Tanacetum coccineum]
MGTVRFGNDHFAKITGYKDYVHGNDTICHVYYVEGLGHNLFSVDTLTVTGFNVSRLKMDNPNITMEEYIRLQEEKALSQGETFNWQTATYGKMEYCEDEDDCFTNFLTKFPAIVLDNTLTSDAAIS